MQSILAIAMTVCDPAFPFQIKFLTQNHYLHILNFIVSDFSDVKESGNYEKNTLHIYFIFIIRRV